MLPVLEQLINISSITGNEHELTDFLDVLLQQMGFNVTRQDVESGRANLIATTDQTPDVILCTHTDTVGPFKPFNSDGDIIFGRGACDAKGQIVAMMEAANRLLDRNVHNIGLLFVVGEETNSIGAKKAATLDLGCKHVILGEPTENRLAIGQKGVFSLKVSCSGIAGHSAYPQRGDSALHRLIGLLDTWLNTRWPSDPELGDTTVNVGKMEGGVAANVIADQAEALVFFRVATSLSELQKQILDSVDDKTRVDIISKSPLQRLGRMEGFEPTVVAFGSDAAHLRPLGQVFMMGPGSIHHAHRDEEQIRMSEIDRASELYVKLVSRLIE